MKKVCECQNCSLSLYYFPPTQSDPEEYEVFLTDEGHRICGDCFEEYHKDPEHFVDSLRESSLFTEGAF